MFIVANLWRCFVCATIVKIVYTLLVTSSSGDLNTFLILKVPDFSQVFVDGLFIGIICGWLGALWIYLFCKLQLWRKTTKWTIVNNRYFWVPFCATIISLDTYWLPNNDIGPKGNYFFGQKSNRDTR